MRHLLARFLDDDAGATAVEYAMLIALFSLGILTWANQSSDGIDANFVEASETLDVSVDILDNETREKGGD